MCHFLESVLSSPKRLVTTFLRSSQPRNLFPSLEAVCPGSPCLQPHCCSPPDTVLLLMWRFLGRFQHSSSFGPDSSFFRWDNWEPKRERDLFKVTHLRVTEQGLILIPSQMLLQKGCCYISMVFLVWTQAASYGPETNLPRFSSLLSRMNSVLGVTLTKEARSSVATSGPLEACSLLDFPLPYSRKILERTLKPWYRWRQLEFYLILCPTPSL